MVKKDNYTQIPIYREIESLYVWLSAVTARAPKIPSWEILCVQIHSDVFHALRMAEAGVNTNDPLKKLDYLDRLAEDIKEVKTVFRLFCRMSAHYIPRVVTPSQERDFYLRMIKIGNNLSHWRNAYLSQEHTVD